jgi:hypothetical protein
MLQAMARIDGILAAIRERQADAVVTGIVQIDPDGLGNDRLLHARMPAKPDIQDMRARQVARDEPGVQLRREGFHRLVADDTHAHHLGPLPGQEICQHLARP